MTKFTHNQKETPMSRSKFTVKRNTTLDSDEVDGDVESIQSDAGPLFRKQFAVNTFDYYFDRDIGEVSKYRALVHILHTASKLDTVNLWIDTNGGRLDATLTIIDAIQQANCTVNTIVHGKAYSAGSLLAMAGMSYGTMLIGERARFMIHSATTGSFGKENEVDSHVRDTLKLIKSLKREFYSGFMTPQELELLDIGKDFYFDAKEARKRAALRVKYLESKQPTKKVKKLAAAVPQDMEIGV